MPNLLILPNELLSEIVSYLDPPAIFYLLLTCRSLSTVLKPSLLLHAAAPKDNMPALHWATDKGHLPLVQYLLTIFPVDLLDDNDATALDYAALSWNTNITEHLLLNGADVNRSQLHHCTALCFACQGLTGNLDAADATIRVLLAYGADVDGDASYWPLYYAISGCSTRITQLLLDKGANPNSVCAGHEPVIVSAAREAEGPGLIELLLDYGANVDAVDDELTSALMVAAKGGYLASVKVLVDKAAKLDSVDGDGYTALSYACMHYHEDIVEYLVGCERLDVIGSDHWKRSPVSLTASHGYNTALRILLQRGAPIHYEDHQGWTLLHNAACDGNEDIVRTLLENGANIESDGHSGVTPLMVAIRNGHLPVVAMLLDHGAERTQGSPDYFVPLMLAGVIGAREVLELMLSKGVDINTVDEDGLTVTAVAKLEGSRGVVRLMAEYGGKDSRFVSARLAYRRFRTTNPRFVSCVVS